MNRIPCTFIHSSPKPYRITGPDGGFYGIDLRAEMNRTLKFQRIRNRCLTIGAVAVALAALWVILRAL